MDAADPSSNDVDFPHPSDIVNHEEAVALLFKSVTIGLDFKRQPEIFRQRLTPERIGELIIQPLPDAPQPLDDVMDEFTRIVLPLCKNEASPHFLGFGDTGDDVAAMAGDILATLTQQNLINQSFDSPSATFVEIAVLRWLRELLGFENVAPGDLKTAWDVGAIITHGGTMSNTIGMMLAREHKAPDTMTRGVCDSDQFNIIVPRGIGHYSVRSSLAWLGLGNHVIEVETRGYRYDLNALARSLRENAGRIMAVVAYAGDSRTQTMEDLRGVHDVVRTADPKIWLHADACWGLLCAFSDQLRHKIDGIALYDSVTLDPHKVMAIPYGLSALVVKDSDAMRSVASYSDLIMQEDFAFGQVTPFIGSKRWLSLKLWMMMLTHGCQGLAKLADRRVAVAKSFAARVDAHPRLKRLNTSDLMAVVFMYVPKTDCDTTTVNRISKEIHARMLAESSWYLHQFSLPDDLGVIEGGATLHPLRFMSANPAINEHHLTGVIDYLVALGEECEHTP